MKRISGNLLALALIVGLAGPALATSDTAILNVSATVATMCTVSGASINLHDAYVGGGQSVFVDIPVSCNTTGVSISLGANAGLHYDAESTWRRISNGGLTPTLLRYSLFHGVGPGTPNTKWGDSDDAGPHADTADGPPMVGDTGVGTSYTFTTRGFIHSSQTGPAGGYTDVVVMTAIF